MPITIVNIPYKEAVIVVRIFSSFIIVFTKILYDCSLKVEPCGSSGKSAKVR